jgi:prophage maintenance system killer protein
LSIPASEAITAQDIEYIIRFNKWLVGKRREDFEVNEASLLGIFSYLTKYDSIKDKRQRIVKKAAHILAGLVFYQEFNDGNKTTALTMTMRYIRRNGFSLPVLESAKGRNAIYNLLVNTVNKHTGDPTIFSEVEEFVMKWMV